MGFCTGVSVIGSLTPPNRGLLSPTREDSYGFIVTDKTTQAVNKLNYVIQAFVKCFPNKRFAFLDAITARLGSKTYLEDDVFGFLEELNKIDRLGGDYAAVYNQLLLY